MAKDFWSYFFGGQEKEDPYSDIKTSLKAKRGDISSIVSRLNAMADKDWAESRKLGMQNIGEGVYSQRGWGRGLNPRTGEFEPGSIYSTLATNLEEKLASARERAKLENEMWGGGQDINLLEMLGKYPEQEDTYEPSPFMNLLSQLISSGVSAGTQGYVNRQSMAGLGDWASRLSSIKPTQTYSSNDSGYSPEFLKMMEDYRKMRA